MDSRIIREILHRIDLYIDANNLNIDESTKYHRNILKNTKYHYHK